MGKPMGKGPSEVPSDASLTSVAAGQRWQPQRDSNPCLHLERVVS